MTVQASKFTPEVLLSAPRRSAGSPNADGSKVLYSVSEYSFASHSKTSEIRVLDVESQQTTLISKDPAAHNPKWVTNDVVAFLIAGEDGVTTVYIWREESPHVTFTAGRIPGPVGDLKIRDLGNDEWAFAVSGKATPDGTLYNPQKANKPLTSGRLYNTTFVRHWDHYVTETRNSIFVGKLTEHQGAIVLNMQLKNVLKGTGLESPIEPFGGADHFDINRNGVVFTAKDPDLNPAFHTKTNIYLIVRKSFWNVNFTAASPVKIDIPGFEGASTGPIFDPGDPSGNSLAFLSMKKDGYESDKNQVFIIPNVYRPDVIFSALATKDGKGSWDRSPQSIIWSSDGNTLFLVAEDHGRGCLFKADIYHDNTSHPLSEPRMLVRGGSIADVQVLRDGHIFISSTSLIESSMYSLLSEEDARSGHVYTLSGDNTPTPGNSARTVKCIYSQARNGTSFGLSRRQIEEVHWPGAADNTSIHAWVIKPSNFDPSKKYPLAYLIHGGPQGAWEDSWSTRWNPCVYAEQGYVVITPNPTGSTGYGQAFTDAIQGQWGGLPYQDLVEGFNWIQDNLDYVDTDRAVALGASYGGYMVNWIQGQDFGRSFRALVTHDGVFSMTGQLASEELYFPFHDLTGPLWQKPKAWAHWDPSRFAEHWDTPHLIIHNDLDYRLTVSEGLAAFNVLQAKGVESQFLNFPDENHWVLQPENSLMWHETVLDWINKHVGLPKYSNSRRGITEEHALDDRAEISSGIRTEITGGPEAALEHPLRTGAETTGRHETETSEEPKMAGLEHPLDDERTEIANVHETPSEIAQLHESPVENGTVHKPAIVEDKK